MSKQMSQISSGFDSHSSKRSDPEHLKHFLWDYFYHAKMKAGALCRCGSAESPHQSYCCILDGKSPSVLLGHKMQENR